LAGDRNTQVVHDDRRTLRSQCASDLATDSASPAGYRRDLAFEMTSHVIDAPLTAHRAPG
jgi:hypothetical protein